MSDVDTPCIGTCKIDAGTRLCEGCLRSIDEITAWAALTPSQRRAIMAELPTRKAKPAGTVKLAG